MEGVLVAVRAVHYGATLVLFGEMVFAHLVSAPFVSAQAARTSARPDDGRHRRFWRVAVAAWALMMISGACWLALVTDQMSSAPSGGITGSTVATVLRATVFGQAWLVRAVLAAMLVFLGLRLRLGPRREPWIPVMSVGVTGGLLAGLAWAGHANAEVGVPGLIHQAADVAHLLAAGAWLGGLAPLAWLLKGLRGSPTGGEIEGCAKIAARFGDWAALSVGVLVLTGVTNAYYLIPTPMALLESTYGNVLLAKLLLFALMLAVAATNRTRLTTTLLANERDGVARVDAARMLRRNVWKEQALGAGVVLLVATLGVTPPPLGR